MLSFSSQAYDFPNENSLRCSTNSPSTELVIKTFPVWHDVWNYGKQSYYEGLKTFVNDEASTPNLNSTLRLMVVQQSPADSPAAHLSHSSLVIQTIKTPIPISHRRGFCSHSLNSSSESQKASNRQLLVVGTSDQLGFRDHAVNGFQREKNWLRVSSW